jgi:acyl carrier protein
MVAAEDILSIIKENDIKVDLEKLDWSISLRDQGLDSLDMTSVLFSIEDTYGIKISDEDIDQGNLMSIDAIVSFINKLEN